MVDDARAGDAAEFQPTLNPSGAKTAPQRLDRLRREPVRLERLRVLEVVEGRAVPVGATIRCPEA